MKHGKLWARILSAMCILALILPMVSTALAASYPYDAISMDDVNLRSRANTTSTVLKKIKAGDLVSILGATGDFYRVKFDGKTGYAMKDYIDGTSSDADEPFDPARAQSAPAAIYAYPYDTVVLQNVKLRKTAEAEGTVIRMLVAGSMVEVLDRTANGFAKVKAEGKTGYVVESKNCAASFAKNSKGEEFICVTGMGSGAWQVIDDHAALYKTHCASEEEA